MATDPKPQWVVMPDWIWAPLAVGGLVGVAGLFGMAVGQTWLFPSLGPTAFLQVESPEQPSSSLRSAVLGHAVGLSATSRRSTCSAWPTPRA